MDLAKLEKVTYTVGSIADLLDALRCQSEEENVSSRSLFMLFSMACDASEKLEELTAAAFAEAKRRNEEANVA